MPLFTDGPPSEMADLTAQDTQLLNMTSVEGIDVTQKLRLAQDELSLELSAMLEGSYYADAAFWLPAQATISNVVVTPALKLWHTYRTLELVYREAYSNQLNDRYKANRDQFQDRAKWAYEKLVQLGIGMCRCPLPQAAIPMVVCAPGNLPDGTYYAAMAWINEACEEGTPSVLTTFTTSGGTLLVQPTSTPTYANAWNVYLGVSPESMSLQNESPIVAGQTWLQPDAVGAGGRAPGYGQSPNYTKPVPRMILRG
jgi:hypothetical protein